MWCKLPAIPSGIPPPREAQSPTLLTSYNKIWFHEESTCQKYEGMLCIRGMLLASAEVLRWNRTCWGQRLHVAQSNLTMTSSARDSSSLELFLLQPDVCCLPSEIMFIWKTDYPQFHGILTPQWLSLQHSVLDRLEPRGSKDREFCSGRSEPKGGGIWWYRFAKRSHLWRVFRTGVLGRCRYARSLLSQWVRLTTVPTFKIGWLRFLSSVN